jgi:hypothetical protein
MIFSKAVDLIIRYNIGFVYRLRIDCFQSVFLQGEDLGADVRKILKYILRKNKKMWIEFIWLGRTGTGVL